MSGPLEPLGRALLDYHGGRKGVELEVRFDTGEEDRLRVEGFFRQGDALDSVDRAALEHAHGRVLDVGAGVGALALPLQEGGRTVTALESLPEAARILRDRGVEDVREADLWAFEPEALFDSVVALMNGSGLAGNLARLPALVARLESYLRPAGILLMDSVDLREDGAPEEMDDGRYVGEVHMQLAYRGLRGDPFPHLFVDPERLAGAAAQAGLTTRILLRQEDGRYLAELSRRER